MKPYLFLILSFTFSIVLFSQKSEVRINTEKIVEQRSIALNGGLRAATGGQSRVVIPLDLKEGTIEWFYSFTTSPGESGTKNLNLAIQLSSFAFDQTGTTARALSEVEIPAGTSKINVYLIDTENKSLFLNGQAFRHYEEGSTESTMHGLFKIDDILLGRWYLGIHNPSTLDGVNVTIEVAALEREEIYIDEWSNETLVLLKKACIDNFAFSENEKAKQEVCDCVISSIENDITPSQWFELGDREEQYERALSENCYLATKNQSLKEEAERFNNNQEDVTRMIEEANASANIGNYTSAKEKIINACQLIELNKLEKNYDRNVLANIYNTVAWYSILADDLVVTEIYLQKGMALDDESMYLWGNTGLYHLLNNRLYEAEKVFTRYKRNERLPDGRKWNKVVADDLEVLEEMGKSNEYFDVIRKTLRIK